MLSSEVLTHYSLSRHVAVKMRWKGPRFMNSSYHGSVLWGAELEMVPLDVLYYFFSFSVPGDT